MINLLCPSTLSEVHRHAVILETQHNRQMNFGTPPPDRQISPPSSVPQAPKHPAAPRSSSYPRPPPAPVVGPRQSFQGCCFNCGDPGHRLTACPHPRSSRTLLLKGDTENLFKTPSVLDEELISDTIETHLQGDVGPLLVLHHVFYSPKLESSSDQRNCIYHSTCTIKGKVCKFIIDSGACENVICS